MFKLVYIIPKVIYTIFKPVYIIYTQLYLINKILNYRKMNIFKIMDFWQVTYKNILLLLIYHVLKYNII